MEELDLYYKVVETIEKEGHEHYNGKYVVDVCRLAEEIVKLFAIPDVSNLVCQHQKRQWIPELDKDLCLNCGTLI
jgi:hypothetical protein